MRPAIRLAALMRVPSIFVFTHDSIFLGEDGPTHQPIEHLDSLRAIPHLAVWRPADGVETAMAWTWIARHQGGPSLLALSRQTVPALVREAPFQPDDVLRGAYCVQDPGGAPQVVLVATGSEVSLACAAAGKLRAEGTAARVVSMPCVSLFLEQPADQQRRLIPDDDTLVVAIEAGRGESLRRFVGRHGLICGIDRFGASAPYPALAEAFGFTPDVIASRVRARLAAGRTG
jgi:transketolase